MNEIIKIGRFCWYNWRLDANEPLFRQVSETVRFILPIYSIDS